MTDIRDTVSGILLDSESLLDALKEIDAAREMTAASFEGDAADYCLGKIGRIADEVDLARRMTGSAAGEIEKKL